MDMVTNNRLNSLPIIAVTCQGKRIEKKCFDAGINEVITKPVQSEKLQQAILFWLSQADEVEIDF